LIISGNGQVIVEFKKLDIICEGKGWNNHKVQEGSKIFNEKRWEIGQNDQITEYSIIEIATRFLTSNTGESKLIEWRIWCRMGNRYVRIFDKTS
jgi:hypothetical protein